MKTYKVKVCDKEIEIARTRTRAIKAYCTDCSVGQRQEIAECPCTMCPLYIFRGYITWNSEKRELTTEQKKVVVDRLGKMRLDTENTKGSVHI
jgi:hypothetical protein